MELHYDFMKFRYNAYRSDNVETVFFSGTMTLSWQHLNIVMVTISMTMVGEFQPYFTHYPYLHFSLRFAHEMTIFGFY